MANCFTGMVQDRLAGQGWQEVLLLKRLLWQGAAYCTPYLLSMTGITME